MAGQVENSKPLGKWNGFHRQRDDFIFLQHPGHALLRLTDRQTIALTRW